MHNLLMAYDKWANAINDALAYAPESLLARWHSAEEDISAEILLLVQSQYDIRLDSIMERVRKWSRKCPLHVTYKEELLALLLHEKE
jgi:hypothetical protein